MLGTLWVFGFPRWSLHRGPDGGLSACLQDPTVSLQGESFEGEHFEEGTLKVQGLLLKLGKPGAESFQEAFPDSRGAQHPKIGEITLCSLSGHRVVGQ